LAELTDAAQSSNSFWKTIRKLHGAQPRPLPVSLDALADHFKERMNPPLSPDSEEQSAREETARRAQEIPLPSPEPPPESAYAKYGQKWSVEDIGEAKGHLKTHASSPSCGFDKHTVAVVLSIDNELLCDLFNEYGYRAIGLESCILKLLTLMTHKRLYAWASELGAYQHHRMGSDQVIARITTSSSCVRSLTKPLRQIKWFGQHLWILAMHSHPLITTHYGSSCMKWGQRERFST
ncbi:hypothetical protein BDZ89DRAFT_1216628, partial [Hymenopellis radicata]